ncbi:MAG: glycosyltransferase [Planctomycetaceae bacterium]|nr:glycosyltransferase [Planctomycetaceae bacterium]
MSQPRGVRESVKAAFRKVGLYPLAAWIMLRFRVARHELLRRIPRRRLRAAREPEARDFDILCLPVIPWNSRFQRPQQLMRHWSERGHRVFYASLQFHHGDDVIVSAATESGHNNLGAPVPGVLEITLPGPLLTSIYAQLPAADHVDRMVAAIDRLRRQQRIAAAVVVVHLPFWTALAEKLRERFGWTIVYDCMDDHSGFSTNNEAMLRAEDRTIATADLVVVTSEVLRTKAASKARRIELIRSACDYEHFAGQEIGGPASSSVSKTHGNERRTIGYYGAIAEWFDGDLVADLARLRPDWRFELIGSTFTGDVSRLQKLPNVALLGEKPYAALPQLIAHWDCCIIPFKRSPLTEATNPMKAYEIMAAGKPLVTVDLPELRLMARDGLVSLANDAHGFAAAIEAEMAADGLSRRQRRRAFAKTNTWPDRCTAMDNAVRDLCPLASIVIVTYNNLALNQACLESIYRYTDWPNYEVIIVDNASTDGTAEWLAELERWDREGDLQSTRAPFPRKDGSDAAPLPTPGRPRIRVILNKDNRGYSAANNQGMRAARGDFLCLLNNDTLVTHGWLSTLIGHLRAMPDTGIVGPVSNRVGNEAIVPVSYTAPEEMPRWAAAYCGEHDGETFPIRMLGFFCVVFPRTVYERVGELDERFGIGCFEDDDYCHRARLEGYELRCARDAFVHHWQGASFQLLGSERSIGVFHENKRLFQDKWAAARTS